MGFETWSDEERLAQQADRTAPILIMYITPDYKGVEQVEAKLENLFKEFEGKVKFGKCNAEEYSGDVSIPEIPRFFVVVHGRVYCELGLGAISSLRTELLAALEEHKNILEG